MLGVAVGTLVTLLLAWRRSRVDSYTSPVGRAEGGLSTDSTVPKNGEDDRSRSACAWESFMRSLALSYPFFQYSTCASFRSQHSNTRS